MKLSWGVNHISSAFQQPLEQQVSDCLFWGGLLPFEVLSYSIYSKREETGIYRLHLIWVACWGVCSWPPDKVSTSCGALALPGTLPVLVPSSSDLKRTGGQEHRPDWPSCCCLLPAICFLDLGAWLSGKTLCACLPACDDRQGFRIESALWPRAADDPQRPEDDSLALWLPELSGPVKLHPNVVWMESWVGQAVPNCSRVGFRQESKVRHGSRVTRAPGRVHVRAYENRVSNQLCLAMLGSGCRCMESS